MLTPKIILQPNDCTPHAENAFHVAADLAKLHGARVVLLYVKPPQDVLVGEFGVLPTETQPTDEQFLQRLNSLAASRPEVKVECQLVPGIPVTEILRAASELKCELIVLASHAHSWFGRLVTGDIAETVANKARCSVVTVRTPNG